MRNRQGTATHCATWEWSKWEDLRENPTTFLKAETIPYTQLVILSWQGKEDREKGRDHSLRKQQALC